MMLVLAGAIAYILGSVPTGYWLGLRLRGVDIREHGSRNIGATNTMRVLGRGLGAIALAVDIAKGLVSVLLIARLSAWEYAPLICGLAAILGHTFSIFLRFQGGKGVATSAGVFFALTPLPMFIALAAFLFVVAMTHMVSAGSIVAALALGIAIASRNHARRRVRLISGLAPRGSDDLSPLRIQSRSRCVPEPRCREGPAG